VSRLSRQCGILNISKPVCLQGLLWGQLYFFLFVLLVAWKSGGFDRKVTLGCELQAVHPDGKQFTVCMLFNCIHERPRKRRPLDNILSNFCSVHSFTFWVFCIHFNVILLCTPWQHLLKALYIEHARNVSLFSLPNVYGRLVAFDFRLEGIIQNCSRLYKAIRRHVPQGSCFRNLPSEILKSREVWSVKLFPPSC
jgi:hypothetical protein